jgi:succinyl-diaminopimelate desuccinylase
MIYASFTIKRNKNKDFSASIDDYKDRIIQDIQRLVKIKSVDDTPKPGMPFGEGVAKALDEALKISAGLGFSAHNLDGYAGYAEAGDGEEVVGILVHLDVVPEGLAGSTNLTEDR